MNNFDNEHKNPSNPTTPTPSGNSEQGTFDLTREAIRNLSFLRNPSLTIEVRETSTRIKTRIDSTMINSEPPIIFKPKNMADHMNEMKKGLLDAIKDGIRGDSRPGVEILGTARAEAVGARFEAEKVETVEDTMKFFRSLTDYRKLMLAVIGTGYAIDPTGKTMANISIFGRFLEVCEDYLTAGALTVCAAKDYGIEDFQTFLRYDISEIQPPRKRGRGKGRLSSETSRKEDNTPSPSKANKPLEKLLVPSSNLTREVQKIAFNEEDKNSEGTVSRKLEYRPFPNSTIKRKKDIRSNVTATLEGKLIKELDIRGFDYEVLYLYNSIANLFNEASKHGEDVEMTLEQIASAGICGDVTDRNKRKKITSKTREKIYKAVKLMSNTTFEAPNMDRELKERGAEGVTISGKLLLAEFIMKNGTSIYDDNPDHLIGIRVTTKPLLFRYAEKTNQLKKVENKALRITNDKKEAVDMTPKRAYITQQLSIRIMMMHAPSSNRIPEPQRTTIDINKFLEDFCVIHYEGCNRGRDKSADVEFIRTVLQCWKREGMIKDFTEPTPTGKIRITLIDLPEKALKSPKK